MFVKRYDGRVFPPLTHAMQLTLFRLGFFTDVKGWGGGTKYPPCFIADFHSLSDTDQHFLVAFFDLKPTSLKKWPKTAQKSRFSHFFDPKRA